MLYGAECLHDLGLRLIMMIRFLSHSLQLNCLALLFNIFSGGISRVKFWLLLSNGLDRLCLVYAKSLPNRSINNVFMYGAIMGQLNCRAN